MSSLIRATLHILKKGTIFVPDTIIDDGPGHGLLFASSKIDWATDEDLEEQGLSLIEGESDLKNTSIVCSFHRTYSKEDVRYFAVATEDIPILYLEGCGAVGFYHKNRACEDVFEFEVQQGGIECVVNEETFNSLVQEMHEVLKNPKDPERLSQFNLSEISQLNFSEIDETQLQGYFIFKVIYSSWESFDGTIYDEEYDFSKFFMLEDIVDKLSNFWSTNEN